MVDKMLGGMVDGELASQTILVIVECGRVGK